MNLISTLEGSMMAGFFPAGWDLARIDACCAHPPGTIGDRQPWWHERFEPIPCTTVADFDVMLGHEIAQTIRQARDAGRPLALILPVGPMGMYRWAVYFLKEWQRAAATTSTASTWTSGATATGRTLPARPPRVVHRQAMERGAVWTAATPPGSASPPRTNAHFATPDRLPEYGPTGSPTSKARRGQAGGRSSGSAGSATSPSGSRTLRPSTPTSPPGRTQTHRLGAVLHPLTIEQNAITSFRSRTMLVPAFANTIGPALVPPGADRIIGGADGILGRGMQWQGMSLWMTLRYGPDPWVPSSFMPTLPGRLFYLARAGRPARTRHELMPGDPPVYPMGWFMRTHSTAKQDYPTPRRRHDPGPIEPASAPGHASDDRSGTGPARRSGPTTPADLRLGWPDRRGS